MATPSAWSPESDKNVLIVTGSEVAGKQAEQVSYEEDGRELVSSPSLSSSDEASDDQDSSSENGDKIHERKGDKSAQGDASTSSLNETTRQLKKTCEPCARSKVKCEGGHPCERCSKRGDSCVYKMEQKRGRRMGSSESLKSAPKPKRTNSYKRQRSEPMIDQEMINGNAAIAPPIQAFTPHQPHMSLFSTHIQPGVGMLNPMKYGGWTQAAPMYQMLSPGSLLTYGLGQQFGLQQPMVQGPAYSDPRFANPAFFSHVVPTEQTIRPLTQRLIRTLFALYKIQRRKSISLSRKAWFDLRFGALQALTTGQLCNDDALRLAMWMKAEGLNPELYDSRKGLSLGLSHGQIIPDFTCENRLLDQTPIGPFLGQLVIGFNGMIEPSTDLMNNLGYSKLDFANMLPVTPFLPLGGDAIAIMSLEDQDSLLFILDGISAIGNAARQAREKTVRWQTRMSLRQSSGLRLDTVVVGCAGCTFLGDNFTIGPVEIYINLASPNSVFTHPYVNLSSALPPWRTASLSTGLNQVIDWASSDY